MPPGRAAWGYANGSLPERVCVPVWAGSMGICYPHVYGSPLQPPGKVKMYAVWAGSMGICYVMVSYTDSIEGVCRLGGQHGDMLCVW